MRRTRREAESVATYHLVQCKMQEEDSAVNYGDIVLDKNKLTSSSYFTINNGIMMFQNFINLVISLSTLIST